MSALDFLKWDRATFRAARTSRLVGYVRKDLVRRQVATNVRNADTISTAALLDLLRVPATTGTARRLAAVMRALHFIPIKSRRLMPGGRAGNTVTRGWARPIRVMRSSPTIYNANSNHQGTIP